MCMCVGSRSQAAPVRRPGPGQGPGTIGGFVLPAASGCRHRTTGAGMPARIRHAGAGMRAGTPQGAEAPARAADAEMR